MTTPASHRSVAAGPSSLGEPDGAQQTDTRFSAVESTPTYRLVFESIERAILEGRLRLGDRLPTESELSAQFGVHRSTTREGLRLLEQSGLAERGDGRRLYAAAPRAGDLSTRASRALLLQRVTFDELWALLHAIEPAAAGEAARAIGPGQIAALEANVQATRAAVEAGEILTAWDIEFHALVAEATGNIAWQLAREPAAMLLFPANERMLPKLPGAGHRLVTAHAAILEALKAGSVADAVLWMRRHIEDFRRGWLVAGLDPGATVGEESAADGTQGR